MQPRIAITCNVMKPDPDRSIYRGKELHYGDASLSRAVIRAGGLPVLMPIPEEAEALKASFDLFDGLILPAGLDMNPKFYGSQIPEAFSDWLETEERDRLEMAACEYFLEESRPVLGICRGAEVINVVMGGTLKLDLHREEGVVHRDQETYDSNRHSIYVEKDSALGGVVREDEVSVVSVHHQAPDRVAPGLRVTARSPDGVAEAVESTDRKPILGVMWHPEWMQGERAGDGVIEWLVRSSKTNCN